MHTLILIGYSSPTTLRQIPAFFPQQYVVLRSAAIVSTAREMICASKNQREDIFYLPHPMPPGQDRFKQFSTPRPEGLDLSQKLPAGMVTSQLNHALQLQIWKIFPMGKSFNQARQRVKWVSAISSSHPDLFLRRHYGERMKGAAVLRVSSCGQGTPYYKLNREAPSERGTVVRLRVYEKGGISRLEGIWKGREICHSGQEKDPKKLTDAFYGCEKVVKTCWFCDWSIF